ncbi:hypothetical protein DACRYDRAFT_24502 [Dacryopinax primogenitus]|uniref:Protein PNS1 n=1 Tax=Dacryopinax primogenitus (strain DJM 731) TaxID=1858805 RepID=M5FPD1_DACPD|nr:uncharacterized protein DACRYDRAFT_24502 [Dacryopinax primogenitus]EJT98450.1 hypothetical protein DACRYDRAFT_24502 [Dacryopinax primogenitus]
MPPQQSSFSTLAAKFITQQSQVSQAQSATSSDSPLFYSTYTHATHTRRSSLSSGSDRSSVHDDEADEHAGGAKPVESDTAGPGEAGMSQIGYGMGMGATMGMLRGSVDPFKGYGEGSSSSHEASESQEEDEDLVAQGPVESISLLPTTPRNMHKSTSHGRNAGSGKSTHPTPPGWRAHPPSRPSSDSEELRGDSGETDDGVPPSYLFTPHKLDESEESEEEEEEERHGRRGQGQTESMLESLLPQEQLRIRPSLGHVLRLPHAGYTVLFGVMLVVSTILSLYALILTPKSSPLPHLTHTLPLLSLLTFLSLLLPPIHIALLRVAVKPALYGTYFLLPVLVLFASLYSFAGSFWSQSLALRIISPIPLIPLLLALPSLPRRLPSINRSSALLRLSATLLLHHPSALAAIMVGALGGAIGGGIIGGGGVRLVFGGSLPTWVASLPILTTLLAYATLLSLRRIALGNVVGRWYLAAPPRSPPDQHESTREAIVLATGPQFGTAVLGALILSLTRTLVWIVFGIQRLLLIPWLPLPPQLSPASFLVYLLNSLEGYNGKAMLMTGINPSGTGQTGPAGTGGNFWSSVSAVRALERGRGRMYRNYDLTRTLLHLLVLFSSLLAALSAYFYSSDSSDSGTLGSAKWRERKAEDVWAAILAGALCWGLGEFGLGGLGDVTDALWMCFSMDLDAGREPRGDVAGAFEGRQERLAEDVEGQPGRNFRGARYAPAPTRPVPQQQEEHMPGGESVMSGLGGMGMSSGLFD